LIKAFHLQDLFSLADLQKQGITLDLEERLVHPRSPLVSAMLSSLLPIESSASTYILDIADEQEHYRGVSQTRKRAGRPEQDVIFIAPSLVHGNGSHAAWQRLLTYVCVKAGEAGNQRIYARLERDGDELQIFKNVGFSAYAEEAIFRLPPAQFPEHAQDTLGLRKQTAADSWSLQRLYAAVTPRTVQIAEGLAQGQWQLNQHWLSEQRHRVGYVWEREGEILAVMHLHTGKLGHWLRLLVHPDVTGYVEELVLSGLSQIRDIRINPGRPIYGSLRTYQSELAQALVSCGFQQFTIQTVVVKHTTVRSEDFVTRLVAAFEGTVEVKRATPTTPYMKTEASQTKPNGKVTAKGGI
jgi:hypothetical protein